MASPRDKPKSIDSKVLVTAAITIFVTRCRSSAGGERIADPADLLALGSAYSQELEAVA